MREPDEHARARIDGSLLVPLGELGRRVVDLDPRQEHVCICHHGIRSARAAMLLRAAGFERVLNLTGGIDRWARDVDRTMARY